MLGNFSVHPCIVKPAKNTQDIKTWVPGYGGTILKCETYGDADGAGAGAGAGGGDRSFLDSHRIFFCWRAQESPLELQR